MNFDHMNEEHEEAELLTEDLRSQQVVRKGGRKHEDLQQKYGGLEVVPADQVTTLMIRNLPRRYTEEALLYELEGFITPDSYNFLYLPWDSRRSSNVGYAFINFVEADRARWLCEQLDGKPWRLVQSTKDIKIMPAHVQGIALNLVHYMGSMVIEDGHAHSPMVIHNGQRISFQKAVEIYCPPDLIRRHAKEAQDAEASTSAKQKMISAPPTQSTTCDATPYGYSHEDLAHFPGYQSEAEYSVTAESGFWNSEGQMLQIPLSVSGYSGVPSTTGYSGALASNMPSMTGHSGKLLSSGASASHWRPELAQLLASEQYIRAWHRLNDQLQAVMPAYQGR